MGKSMQHRYLNGQTGFTLVEAMVTLAVTAILLTWAVPSLKDFITRNRMSTEVNNFVAALYLARSEAVKRMRDVSLCPIDSINPTACAGTTSWAQGWMVYADLNNNNAYDDGEMILQQPKVSFDITGITFITFNSRGSSNAGSFSFTDPGGVAGSRCVTLSSSGRPYLTRDACP